MDSARSSLAAWAPSARPCSLLPLVAPLVAGPRRVVASFVELCHALWLAPRILRLVQERLLFLCLVAAPLEKARREEAALGAPPPCSPPLTYSRVHVSGSAEGEGVTAAPACEPAA